MPQIPRTIAAIVPVAAVLMLAACTSQTPVVLPAFEQVQVSLTTATTWSFQLGVLPSPSYLGAHDTSLAQASPTSAMGLLTTCMADADDPGGTHNALVALLAWDISQVPADATVQSAKITLRITNPSPGTWQLYGLKRTWDEATATWRQAATGQPWQTAGAAGPLDRDTVLVGSLVAPAVGVRTIELNAAGVALVQGWVKNPGSNQGLILVGSNADGVDFVSAQGAATDRPRLDVSAGSGIPPGQQDLVVRNDPWRYLDTGVAPAATWRTAAFNDSAWKQGVGEFGYGDGDETTVVGYGGNANAKYITTWFRRSFTVADASAVQSLLLATKRDDGVIVYLNGTEIWRSNMPAGAVSPATLASAAIEDENWYQVQVPATALVSGANVLSAEVHQANATSSDITFWCTLSAVTAGTPGTADGVLIPEGSTWQYRDTGVAPANTWRDISFDDSTWKSGAAELGYGDGDEQTVVGYGGNANAKFITTWFRRSFDVANPASWLSLSLRVRYDDGAVVYLNGVEVLRGNLPGGAIGPGTLASASVSDGNDWQEAAVGAGLLKAGKNVVAVEVHQTLPTSSDISFELTLDGVVAACAPGCSDGNPCTQNDACAGMVCVGTPMDCNDNDACTTDACTAGQCTHTSIVAACDDQNPCTTDGCSASTGCTHANNTLACDDGNSCTSGDACQGGECGAGAAVTCDDGNSCTGDVCDPSLGCTHANLTSACDDGNPCTDNDVCQGGACKGVGHDCDDQNPCTDDSCSLAAGCAHTNNALPCDDGNACTAADACANGGCMPGTVITCEDNDVCTNNLCDTASGCYYPPLTGAVCDDGNACTTTDKCAAGVCAGVGLNCDDKNPCTTDSCVVGSGCLHVNNTLACSDGSLCTVGDVCVGGTCQAGSTALNCDDSNVCTDDGCNATTGCTHAFNTAPCSDGSTCTSGDACQSGVCKSAAQVNCDDLNPCTTDSCLNGTGCVHVATTAACSDGTACTTGDACSLGVCKGTALNCDDANACTADSCDAVLGCQHVNTAATCSDGNGCTTVDACVAGVCVGSSPKVCDDGDPCTLNGCTAATGKCAYTPSSTLDGTSCTPSGGCTSATCQGGVCQSLGCNLEQWPWTVPASFQPATKWFDPVGYHVVEFTVAAGDWTKYLNDVKNATTDTWYKADAKIDGVTFAQVGIKAFGYGSMLSNPGKPNIRIKFHQFISSLRGPENLKNARFKASGQDSTFLREPLSYGISRALGGAAPQSSWARIKVNGVNYGFFIVLEHVDEDFFAHFWGNSTGHFYEQNNGCVGINCATAACTDVLGAYGLTVGTGSDLVALASAVHSGSAAAWVAAASLVADMDSLLVFYAMDVLTSNVDGMTTAGNNFDIYGDTSNSLLYFIHHGMDLVLGNWSAWYSFTAPWGPPCSWCNRAQEDFYARMLETPALKQKMWDLYKSAHCGPFSKNVMVPLVDKMKALIVNDVYNDPKGIEKKAQIDADYTTLKNYLNSRHTALDALVGTCP